VKLRLASLPPPRGAASVDLAISSAPQAPTLVVPQLTAIRTAINTCLDIIDVTTWTGDATDANFVAGQLRLLHEHIQEARQALKGHADTQPPWWESPLDEQTFDPPLPSNVSFHLYVFDAALVLEIRTLEGQSAAADEGYTGFNLRDRLYGALGGARPPAHDETDQVFTFCSRDVRVKEKIRVEAQDPALISAMAKLNALEHNVLLSRKALHIVMGREEQME
jgi:hypothetical protein